MYIYKMETWFVLCLGWLKLRDFCFNCYFLICKMFQHSAWYWDFIDTFGSQAPEPLSRAYVFSIRALKLLQLLPLLCTYVLYTLQSDKIIGKQIINKYIKLAKIVNIWFGAKIDLLDFSLCIQWTVVILKAMSIGKN